MRDCTHTMLTKWECAQLAQYYRDIREGSGIPSDEREHMRELERKATRRQLETVEAASMRRSGSVVP